MHRCDVRPSATVRTLPPFDTQPAPRRCDLLDVRHRFLPITAAVLVACGGTTPSRPTEPAPSTPPPAPTTAQAPADPYAAALNLDFEKMTDGVLDGWRHGIGKGSNGVNGYEITPERDAHGGATSLRLRATDDASGFGATSVSTDATPLRGKRVRLHAWIKTDGVAAPGWAGVWLRVDGSKEGAFDNMQGRGLTGTEGWREAVVQVDVPGDAGQLVLGPLLVGGGTAWFDDLRLEIVDVPPVKPITLAGVVVDPAGAPAAGATVTLMDAGGTVVSFVTTDVSGRFELGAKTGAWGMSAHHPSGVGTFFDPRELGDDTRDLRFQLGADGVLVRGRVTVPDGAPAGFHVEVAPYSNHVTDAFVVAVGADGRFEARLPKGEMYFAKLRGEGLLGTGEGTRKGDEVAIEVKATVLGPPPAEVSAWVAEQAVPLVSAEAGNGYADLKPLGKMIGKARIVALGEATHGTREFFQLKHRVLEYLVAEHGFDAFVIEANLPECRAINDYVLHGKGDPQQALDGIYFWTWNTEEVLAMIEWMRAWNADPKHTKKVRFYGDDMQTATVAHANVVAFLRRVAPAEADALVAPLAILGTDRTGQAFAAKPAADAQVVLDAVAALTGRFDRERTRWSKAAGKDAYLDAREDVRVLAQAAALFRAGNKSFDARDLAMADNVDHILARLGKRSRVVLWAHNAHVANGLAMLKNQGQHLRERHGKDYFVFGFAFGEGSFQAIDWSKGKGSALAEHTLGPPPVWDVSAPFRATGKPIVVVDLRTAPRGVVADWFAAPHPMRETGAVFSSEEGMTSQQTLSKRFDAVIYVDKTTRARPTPGADRE